MSPTAAELLKQALELDERDRATLAGALIESLDAEVDADAEAAWDKEIGRRVAELEAGSVATVAWSEVRDRLFSGLR
jgi:putative addiction module component (TIGR02574 family)